MGKLILTPSQTVGPYLAIGLPWDGGETLVPAGTEGRIRIEGQVFDGAGDPVIDALVEVWQANRNGRYTHPEDTGDAPPVDGFTGFGRCPTDGAGRFWFATVKPGRVAGRGNSLQAPHLAVTVFARGMLKHLFTRIYFPDEAAANAEDPVLGGIEDRAVRATLVAAAAGERDGMPVYRFDIHLQGAEETAFFDI